MDQRGRGKPADAKILGEAGAATSERPKGVWKPVSDRKIRVGVIGYGACKFGAAVRFPGSSQRDGDGRQRPVSGPLQRPGQGMPLQQDLSVAGGTAQGRLDRGRVFGHRRPQPCPARDRRAEARQARGHGGAGRLRLAGRRRQTAGGGQVERAEIHDVRDLRLPRRLLRDAADLSFRRLRQTHLFGGRILPLHAHPIDSYHGWRIGAAAAMVSHALERLLRMRQRRQLHRSDLPGHAQPDQGDAAGEQPLQESLRRPRSPCFGPARAACRGWR